ncbi:MAG: histidine kinase [Bryobacterales bacterium]|nr:histidine kinase [Bryobacterales bacterium]
MKRALSRALAWFALWTGIGLFFSTQLFLINHAVYKRQIDWEEAIVGTLPEWWMWFLLTPAMLWMARRFRFERAMWWWAAMVHLATGCLFTIIALATYAGICYSLGWRVAVEPTYRNILWFLFSVKFHWGVLTYAMVLAVVQASDYYRKFQEREAMLAKAQLHALKSQLHPHFLFNSLHATMALVRRDPTAAERMIMRLSELLRATLESGGEHEVPLKQEIRFLEQYLEIERTRFADRLSISMDIDPAALELAVPNMILQPLVENAVKHGISPRAAKGTIVVRAQRNNGHLRLEVSDDGVGLGPGPVREGIGLSNTRERLRQLYGDHQKMQLYAPAEGGFTAALEIPAKA